MANIEKVFFSDAFWQDIEKHRKHPRFDEMRAKLRLCAERKMHDRNFQNNSDCPFTGNKTLQGIWHAKLSRDPDVVIFYVLDGDTIKFAKAGSHKDYPYNGKNAGKAKPLAEKIFAAIARNHAPTPNWRNIKWTTPQDIIESPDLFDASMEELDFISNALNDELQEGFIYKKLHGRELIEEDEIVLTEWLNDTTRALDRIRGAKLHIERLANHKNHTPVREAIKSSAMCAP